MGPIGDRMKLRIDGQQRQGPKPCRDDCEAMYMDRVYTAVTKQDGDWWIGWIQEIPGVNCQERTHEELIESLKATLREALEFNRQDAIAAVGTDFREEQIAI